MQKDASKAKLAVKRSGSSLKISDKEIEELLAEHFPEDSHQLQELVIQKNKSLQRLQPAIFSEVMAPQTLQVLVLEKNAVTSLPPELCNMISLRELRLNHNQLKSLPANIGNLTHLQKLHAEGNALTMLPPSLCQITSLRQLVVPRNRIMQLPVDIDLLTNLKELDVSGNPLVSPPAWICAKGISDIRQWSHSHKHAHSLPGALTLDFVKAEDFDTSEKNGTVVEVLAPWYVQIQPRIRLLVEVATAESPGRRNYMEDRHTLATLKLKQPEGKVAHFFGVYDGHEGSGAAVCCQANMHRLLEKQPDFAVATIENAWLKAFAETEALWMSSLKPGKMFGGSTAVASVLVDNIFSLAWVGDSRAIIANGPRALRLSRDHKPDLDDEKKRIVAAGGFIEEDDDSGTERVNGILCCTRSIGDHDLKVPKQVVSPVPEIKTITLTPRHQFIAIGSDGVFDFFGDQYLTEFIRKYQTAKEACEAVMAKRLSDKGRGKDNATLILIKLHWSVAHADP